MTRGWPQRLSAQKHPTIGAGIATAAPLRLDGRLQHGSCAEASAGFLELHNCCRSRQDHKLLLGSPILHRGSVPSFPNPQNETSICMHPCVVIRNTHATNHADRGCAKSLSCRHFYILLSMHESSTVHGLCFCLPGKEPQDPTTYRNPILLCRGASCHVLLRRLLLACFICCGTTAQLELVDHVRCQSQQVLLRARLYRACIQGHHFICLLRQMKTYKAS